MCLVYFVFFFKQKTAYEMRISDWSSDVCSSDLPQEGGRRSRRGSGIRAGDGSGNRPRAGNGSGGKTEAPPRPAPQEGGHRSRRGYGRSEEHTSELQSLMRSSYAVFCLIKKNHNS